MSLAFWLCAAVSAASAAVSLGFSIAGLATAERNARTASRYALARSIGLAVVATCAFFAGSVAFLAAIAIAMIVVQAGDAVIGVALRDRMKAVGPAATAVVNIVVLVWLLA